MTLKQIYATISYTCARGLLRLSLRYEEAASLQNSQYWSSRGTDKKRQEARSALIHAYLTHLPDVASKVDRVVAHTLHSKSFPSFYNTDDQLPCILWKLCLLNWHSKGPHCTPYILYRILKGVQHYIYFCSYYFVYLMTRAIHHFAVGLKKLQKIQPCSLNIHQASAPLSPDSAHYP